jgi:hypothetical protein
MKRTARFIVLCFAFVACRTREDAAVGMAREAASAAETSCEKAADRDECRESFCRSRCSPFSDSAHLTQTCVSKCTGRDVCDSDRDCAPGLTCVIIAPRVRHCQTATDAAM